MSAQYESAVQPAAPDNRNERNEQVQAILELYSSLGEGFAHIARTSAALIGQNISSELSNSVNESIDNPISSAYGGYSTMRKLTYQVILNDLLIVFSAYKDKIASLYQTYESNLHFCIVLIDDAVQAEHELESWLMDYDCLPVSDYFPVVFEFIPQELEGELLYWKKISL